MPQTDIAAVIKLVDVMHIISVFEVQSNISRCLKTGQILEEYFRMILILMKSASN